MQVVQDAIDNGKVAKGNEDDAYRQCCERTGGLYSPNGNIFAECHTASDPKPYAPGRLPSHTLNPGQSAAPRRRHGGHHADAVSMSYGLT
jgi:hypothetical protein